MVTEERIKQLLVKLTKEVKSDQIKADETARQIWEVYDSEPSARKDKQ